MPKVSSGVLPSAPGELETPFWGSRRLESTREKQTKAQSDKVMQISHMFSYLSLPDTVPGSVEYKSDGIVNVDIQQLPSLSSSHGSTPRRWASI